MLSPDGVRPKERASGAGHPVRAASCVRKRLSSRCLAGPARHVPGDAPTPAEVRPARAGPDRIRPRVWQQRHTTWRRTGVRRRRQRHRGDLRSQQRRSRPRRGCGGLGIRRGRLRLNGSAQTRKDRRAGRRSRRSASVPVHRLASANGADQSKGRRQEDERSRPAPEHAREHRPKGPTRTAVVKPPRSGQDRGDGRTNRVRLASRTPSVSLPLAAAMPDPSSMAFDSSPHIGAPSPFIQRLYPAVDATFVEAEMAAQTEDGYEPVNHSVFCDPTANKAVVSVLYRRRSLRPPMSGGAGPGLGAPRGRGTERSTRGQSRSRLG